MPTLGFNELLIILAIILLLFGSTKIPQLAGSLGKAMKEFKKSTKEDDSSTGEKDKVDDQTEQKAKTTA